MLSENDLERLNELSVNNMENLESGQQCGCFFCGRLFTSDAIESCIEDEGGDTALCPFCEMDAVVSDGCGFEINAQLLKELHDFWFC